MRDQRSSMAIATIIVHYACSAHKYMSFRIRGLCLMISTVFQYSVDAIHF